jgi:hypothetical protein
LVARPRQGVGALLMAGALACLVACSQKHPEPEIIVIPKEEQRKSIGSATMLPDGTIVLLLSAEGPNGEIGDTRYEYPPNHPQYAEILKHVGPLRPGDDKPVAPWPE